MKLSLTLAIVLAAGAAAAEVPAPDEKLLLGFEKEEMARIAEAAWQGKREAKPPFVVPADPKARRRCAYIADFKDAYDCHLGWYFGQAYGYLMYLIRKGEATEGEFAAARDYRAANEASLAPYRARGTWKAEFQKRHPGMYEQYARYGPAFASYMDAVLEWTHDCSQLGARECSLLYTLGWFGKAMPSDWSAYDELRVDALSTQAGVADLRIEVEDELGEPMAARSYQLPAGQWATLTFDLRAAAAERRLDLARIANLYIWLARFQGGEAKPTSLLLDNLRLARKGKGKTQPLAVAGRPWVPPEPPILKAPTPTPEPPKPNRAPIASEKPIVIDVGAMGAGVGERGGGEDCSSRGMVSAFDNERMLVTFEGAKGGMFALSTRDGGKTWRGLDDAERPTRIRTAGGETAFGGGAAEQGGFTFVGCTHDIFDSYCTEDWPTPRHWAIRIAFDGQAWSRGPFCFVTSDARHCYSRASVLTLDSGRMWTALTLPDRHKRIVVEAKYSDDGGLTWRSWRGPGLSGKVDGSDDCHNGSSGGDRWILLAPFGDHVACFWLNRFDAQWSFYDGQAWTAPQKAGKGKPLSVATLKAKDLFLSTDKGVFRYDGQAWAEEKGARPDGLLARAGADKLLLFGVWDEGKIACQARGSDGMWTEPKVLAEEPGFKKRWGNFGVPQASPPNFVPIVWTLPGQKAIKLLRAPVE